MATATTEQITAVLLEEIGHDFDHILNDGADSQGDEGEIFASLVREAPLNESTLNALKLQDDINVIELDGQEIMVEQALLPPVLTTGWVTL